MNKKLQNSILYALSKQGQGKMEIMRLAKYLYLADYVFAKSFGRKHTFTGTYSRFEYGPVPTDFYPAITSLYKDGSLVRVGNIISLVKPLNYPILTEEEKACLDWVSEHFLNDSLQKVKEAAYGTEPMAKIQEYETAIGGEKLLMEDLDFSAIEAHPLLDNDVDTSFLDSAEYREALSAS